MYVNSALCPPFTNALAQLVAFESHIGATLALYVASNSEGKWLVAGSEDSTVKGIFGMYESSDRTAPF